MRPPSALGLAGWWLLTIACFFPGAAAAGGIAMVLAGPDVSSFLPLVFIAYGLVHWTACGLLGGAALGAPHDPTWTGLLDRFRLRPVGAGPLVATVAVVAGLGLGVSAVLTALDLQDVGALGELRARLRSLGPGPWLVWAVVLTFAPAFGEEIFFRGFLLHGLDAAGSRATAIGGSALLFAVTHLDLVQSAATAPLGLFIGWAVLRTGSLWTGIVAHAFNNALAGLMSESSAHTGLWAALAAPLAMAGLWWLIRQPAPPKVVW